MVKKFAGIKKRLIATMIDYSIVLVYAIVLFGVARLIYALFFDRIPTFGRIEQEALAFFTLVFPSYLYLVILENGRKKSTIGKQKMAIYISTYLGNQPTLLQIMIRNAIKLLPWQLAHTFLFTGIQYNWNISNTISTAAMIMILGLPILSILFICIRKDHRSVHDLIAKTYVVGAYEGI